MPVMASKVEGDGSMRESDYLTGRNFLLAKFKKLPFLGSIDEQYLRKIISLSKLKIYADQEIITQEGSHDSWVFILLSGEVKIVKEEKVLAHLHKTGDTFGEMAMIDGKNRSASVYAIGETLCLAFDGAFLDTVEERERLSFYAIFYHLFAEILAERLRITNAELVAVKQELDHLKAPA